MNAEGTGEVLSSWEWHPYVLHSTGCKSKQASRRLIDREAKQEGYEMYTMSAAGSLGAAAISLSIFLSTYSSRQQFDTIQPTATHLVIQAPASSVPTPGSSSSVELLEFESTLSQAQFLTIWKVEKGGERDNRGWGNGARNWGRQQDTERWELGGRNGETGARIRGERSK